MRAHGRNVPVRDLCLLEAAWARLVRVARLAPMSRCTGKSNAEARSGLHSRTRLPRAYESKLTNILVRRGAPAASPVPATPTQRGHMMGGATEQKRQAFAGPRTSRSEGPGARASRPCMWRTPYHAAGAAKRLQQCEQCLLKWHNVGTTPPRSRRRRPRGWLSGQRCRASRTLDSAS